LLYCSQQQKRATAASSTAGIAVCNCATRVMHKPDKVIGPPSSAAALLMQANLTELAMCRVE
jgi:hypothetical protein